MSRSTHRTVRESRLYQEQITEYGNRQAIDEALEAVVWAVSTKPDFFEPIPGTHLRFVRTIEFEREGLSLIPLKIWFRILDDNVVELLSVTPDEYEWAFVDPEGEYIF